MKFVLALVTSLMGFITTPTSPTIPPTTFTQPSPTPISHSLIYAGKEYSYYLAHIPKPQNLKLAINLPQPQSSQKLIADNHCQILINGGFYDKSNRPLGLIISDTKQLNPSRNSQLLNGFISIHANQVIIDDQPPEVADTAAQSGPILILDQNTHVLSMKNDKPARRIIAAVTKQQSLYLIGVTDKGFNLSGPYLEDLPNLIIELGRAEGLTFSAALNLDGGTASAFYSTDFYLEEANPIGSYLCYPAD